MSQSTTRIKYEIARIEKIVTDAKVALETYEPVLKVYKEQAAVFEAKEAAAKEAKEAAAKESSNKTPKATK